MAAGQLNSLVRQIERLFNSGSVTGMNEGQLLERFVSKRDEAAFQALVARHGPMVLGVCRQFLRDPNDVEDAFQATFLVLVRKAATLRDRNLLGNWLYGVAYRVAVRARATSSRRHATETPGVEELAVDGKVGSHEPRPWLHEEIHRLPEKYRLPIVLCYLEGLTHEEAADQLHWPIGTVKGRLSRARDVLRSRLTSRGLALPGGLLAFHMTGDAVAAVPASLVESTIKAAMTVAAGQSAASALISVQAVALSEGVVSAMLISKLKAAVVILVSASAVLATSAMVFARQFATTEGTETPAAGTQTATEKGARKEFVPKGQVPVNQAANVVNPGVPAANSSPPAGGIGGGAAGPGMGGGMGGMGGGMRGMGGGMGGMGGGMGGMGGGMGGMGGGMGGMGGRRALLNFEDQLRIKVATMVSSLEQGENISPKTRAVLKKLEEPVTMSFANETPLEEVLKYIKSSVTGGKDSGIPVYVDPLGLREVEATLTSPIVIDLEGVPLKTSLRLLLKQLRLAYCVKDGLLIISSVNGIYQELREEGVDEPGETGLQ